MKKNYKNIINSLMILIAILGALVKIDPSIPFRNSFSYNPMTIMVILVLFYLFNKRKIENNRDRKIFIIFGVIFSLAHLLGYSVYHFNNLDILTTSIPCFVKSVLKFIYYLYLYTNIVSISYECFNNIKKNKDFNILNSSKKSFFIRTIIILLLYLPFYLYEYPGVFTVDSVSEMNSAMYSLGSLINHHPVAHIYLISLFMNLGKLCFGTINGGIALYSITQMIVTALTFSHIISFLDKKKVNNIFKIISFLFFLLYPPFIFYSFTMWKDVPFALSMVYFTIQIIEIFLDKKYLKKASNIFKVILSAVFVILFRNNGIYVVILSFIVFFLFYKSNKKQIGFILVFIFVFYIILKGPIFSLLNVKDGPTREALSVPIQQIARTYKLKKEYLDDKDIELIHKYITSDDIEEKYYPLISDNMKDTFSEELFKKNKGDFIGLWFRLFLKYPKIYFESYFIGSMGYWYPEVDNWVLVDWFDYDEFSSIGYSKEKIIAINQIDRLINGVNSREIPLVSILFSIGFFFWLLILLIGYTIYKKNYSLIYIFMPILFLWLTTTASPVWCEYRYIFSMFTTFPLLLSIAISNSNEKSYK